MAVANKTMHEEVLAFSYDVAVYKLEQPLKFNKRVKAVQLSTDKVKPGTVGVVIGPIGSDKQAPVSKEYFVKYILNQLKS